MSAPLPGAAALEATQACGERISHHHWHNTGFASWFPPAAVRAREGRAREEKH
jgi:hypothetical protein